MRQRPGSARAGLSALLAAALGIATWLPPSAAALPAPGVCTGPGKVPGTAEVSEPVEGPPAYYAVELVSTRRLPGTRNATGVGEVTFAGSPFGVALSPEGTYRQDLSIRVEGLPDPGDEEYVVWVTTPQLDRIHRLGAVSPDGSIEATVDWNKFLVVVSLEPAGPGPADSWQGPIVLRGMSRSGRMHTMAGHGPFQVEPCAQYGY